MGQFPLTLSRFIAQEQAAQQGVTGELAGLLPQIGLVGKLIAQDLRRAGLIDILGATGEINVQGEAVKKLDEIANETFVTAFHQSGLVCALASEEMEKPVLLPEHWPQAKYMLLCRPSRWLIEHGLQHAARHNFFRREGIAQRSDADRG